MSMPDDTGHHQQLEEMQQQQYAERQIEGMNSKQASDAGISPWALGLAASIPVWLVLGESRPRMPLITSGV